MRPCATRGRPHLPNTGHTPTCPASATRAAWPLWYWPPLWPWVGLYRRQQMTAPDISLGAERDSTDAALAQASDLLQGNENFMTAHNL